MTDKTNYWTVFLIGKSATGIEWQVGRLYGGFCLLIGGHYKWYSFFNRFHFGWDRAD